MVTEIKWTSEEWRKARQVVSPTKPLDPEAWGAQTLGAPARSSERLGQTRSRYLM
jgi:hypothetical protein